MKRIQNVIAVLILMCIPLSANEYFIRKDGVKISQLRRVTPLYYPEMKLNIGRYGMPAVEIEKNIYVIGGSTLDWITGK